MLVYDSIYTDIDCETKREIAMLLSCPNITVSLPPVQKQKGVKDCGCFSLAFATHLTIDFSNMLHLIMCFE